MQPGALRLRPGALARPAPRRAGARRRAPSSSATATASSTRTAFRRLVYKTQVFLNHEGDLFRTRLTHSLEVAQLARSIARALRLNEDLVEAIALAHDLGHTPFGHAGQDALNDCMSAHGGFEHNLQSLRVVDALEQRYPAVRRPEPELRDARGHPQALLARQRRSASSATSPAASAGASSTGTQPSLEAQLCNLADEIAYNAHDIDDGVRSGLLGTEQLREVPLFARIATQALAEGDPRRPGRRLLYESIRRMLSAQVYDVIADDTRRAGARTRLPTPTRCAALPPLVALQRRRARDSDGLKRFLFGTLYRHPQVMQTTERGRAGGARAVRRLPGAAARDARPHPRARRPRARGGRLHRRHDRPLRAARARAPDRPGAVRRRGMRWIPAPPFSAARAGWRRPGPPRIAEWPACRDWCCRACRTIWCSAATTASRSFADDADRTLLIEALNDGAHEQGIAVHAYALLDNEVHLLVRPPRHDSLGRADAGARPALRGRLQPPPRTQRHAVGRALSRRRDRTGRAHARCAVARRCAARGRRVAQHRAPPRPAARPAASATRPSSGRSATRRSSAKPPTARCSSGALDATALQPARPCRAARLGARLGCLPGRSGHGAASDRCAARPRGRPPTPRD